jgi:hypothetical protein
MTVFTIVAAICRMSAPPTIAPNAATELVLVSAGGVTGGAASSGAVSAGCGPVDMSDSAEMGGKSGPLSPGKMD